MKNETKVEPVKAEKINLVLDINKHLQNEIKNSKYIKWTIGIVTTVGALYALGYVFKVFNFTVHNYKNLKSTLKNKY